MPAEIQPPALAHLADVAERPRVDDWSLRAALVRYAQPQPERVSQVLEQVRRIELALHPHQRLLEREGPTVWDEVTANGDPTVGERALLVGVLRATMPIDEMGDVLAAWAVHREGDRPDDAVDAAVRDTAARLDELGVPREEAPPGPPRRGGERRR